MDLVKKKREERGSLAEQMRSIVGEAKKSAEGTMTSEQVVEWNKLNDQVDALKAEIDVLERQEQIDAEMANHPKPEAREFKDMSKDEIRDKTNKAWFKLIMARGNARDLSQEERMFLNPEQRTNAQSTTDAKGGFTIPEGFSNELEIAKLAWGSVESVARIVNTTTGNDIPWPGTDDTSNVAYQIAEAVNAETSAVDVTFAKLITLKAYKWTSGFVRVSHEILQDSYFDMSTLLKELFAMRMGRGLNAAYTTGAGTTTIEGVVIGATDSAISSVGATAITRANLVDLEHSVDPAYRFNARFMFNDGTLAAIKKLTIGSADDRPLWQPGMAAGAPDTVDGFPYVINQQMADVGASAKSVLFGDFKNYLIRKVTGDRVVIANELFAATDQIGIMLLQRRDGQVLDAGTNPIKYMVHAAS